MKISSIFCCLLIGSKLTKIQDPIPPPKQPFWGGLPEVRSHALRALTSVIYDRRSLKVLTIYDPRYRENASTTYDLRSLPFLTIRDLRSMTFQLTIDDLSPFVRFTIYGSRDSIHGLRSTIDDRRSLHLQRRSKVFRKQLNEPIEPFKMIKNEFVWLYFQCFHIFNALSS